MFKNEISPAYDRKARETLSLDVQDLTDEVYETEASVKELLW